MQRPAPRGWRVAARDEPPVHLLGGGEGYCMLPLRRRLYALAGLAWLLAACAAPAAPAAATRAATTG